MYDPGTLYLLDLLFIPGDDLLIRKSWQIGESSVRYLHKMRVLTGDNDLCRTEIYLVLGTYCKQKAAKR